ncbi:hypothetical protein IPM62_03485 [Candidatus Woesebacteria bacterium]|nr:MAG: hypothetical protein IPM62_03485 [Candidatus Woesebacteria bacterium]
MIKIISKLIFIVVLLVISVKPAMSKDAQVNVYFFWGEGCPHCAKEKPFLESLERKYPEVNVVDFEIWNNKDNRELLMDVSEILNFEVSGVPLTIVGNKEFVGFNESVISKQIENHINTCINNSCDDSLANLVGLTKNNLEYGQVDVSEINETQAKDNQVFPDKIDIPIFGEITTKSLSLPIFTIILGALDGFNPCAMWTLLFLISLLLGMKDKKRRWILGTTFIITSGFVYFLFMAAWLNIILFIGFIVWVRSLIALIALLGGSYNLREYFVNKNSGCKVTGDEKRRIVFEKIKAITQQKKFAIALMGIIILAFAVNLVELICSAGLPVIFTQVLSLSNLPTWQYYLYMMLYIFIFMLDDLFVFFTAMLTLEMTGISTKYSRVSHLIGGLLMITIGLLLFFKPEWLMFG